MTSLSQLELLSRPWGPSLTRPGLSFHKLDRAKDQNFWSVRVSRDIRIIVHKTQSSLLLCYVDHHDDAYRWAERRKLEVHPKTGAAQLVEIRETFEEITVPVYVEGKAPAPAAQQEKPRLFSTFGDDELLKYGVPEEWLEDVKNANEDSLLELADHLPSEAAEALLEIATGGTPKAPEPSANTPTDPFEHPDARRRFRTLENTEELERALDFPWDKWTVFLHPAQRDIVESRFSGPARVAGSAGTGKTIVALHRAVFLAQQNDDSRVLLTTFSTPLANALKTKLHRLVKNRPQLAERIDVRSMDQVGRKLFEAAYGRPKLATSTELQEMLQSHAAGQDLGGTSRAFLLSEWQEIIDAWGIETWETYRDVKRLGRKTRLPESRRQQLWAVFEALRADMSKAGLITPAELYRRAAQSVTERANPPYDHVVVDEAQDISVAQLQFIASLATVMDSGTSDSLFLAGDLGQRIFQTPFSWASLGVEVRGRSRILRVNYRTSHQIRSQADKLLGPAISDVDGNTEDRSGTVSVFNGPYPAIVEADSEAGEIERVAAWLKEQVGNGVHPNEIGVIVRSESEIARGIKAVELAGIEYGVIDESGDASADEAAVSTMHLAKGMEFRSVAVMACDDEVIPSQRRIDEITDEADLEEVYNTERHLLYVACTRARDHLQVSGVRPMSEFLEDFLFG